MFSHHTGYILFHGAISTSYLPLRSAKMRQKRLQKRRRHKKAALTALIILSSSAQPTIASAAAKLLPSTALTAPPAASACCKHPATRRPVTAISQLTAQKQLLNSPCATAAGPRSRSEPWLARDAVPNALLSKAAHP